MASSRGSCFSTPAHSASARVTSASVVYDSSSAGYHTHTSRPYLSAMRDISTIISICGRGKCGLSAASSDRGGMSSIALVPKMARSRMY
jgi:hypothetical protein